jgi:ribosomal protein L12E/L44/L45/RPP1/RPP2
MSVTDAVKDLPYTIVRKILMAPKPKGQGIAAPGKGMKQLISTISKQKDVGLIVKKLNMLRTHYAATHGKAVKTPSSKQHTPSKKQNDDEEDDEDDEDEEEDDAMIMLKEELALRGLTTTGNTYPVLVKRLCKTLREED